MEGKDGKTERATPKRLKEERDKGNLCISPEVTSLVVLLVGLLALRFAVPPLFQQLRAFMVYVVRFDQIGPWTPETICSAFAAGLTALWGIMVPIVVPILLATILSNMVQTKPYFSMKAQKFDLAALSPGKGIKSLFSVQTSVRTVLGLLKVALIALTAYFLIRKDLILFVGLSSMGCASSVEWIFRYLYRLAMTVVVLFGVIAALDWIFRKRQYEKNMMMTKQEVTEERKQYEPSPLVRKAMMKRMRQLSLARMMAAVPNANVVITNPDHVAVAIEYDSATMGAPKVTAKGLRLMAERIKQVARENNVPIVRRPETARALYKHVEVGHPIPGQLFEAVAEILAYLHRLGRDIGLNAA